MFGEVTNSRSRNCCVMAPNREKKKVRLVRIADMYTRDLNAHGVGPKSVGWRDEASQRLRFEKLVQVIDWSRAHEGISVSDLGCGYGAMFRYLDEVLSGKLVRYYGYDISEEMLAAAEEFVSDPRAKFIRGSHITHEADYSFVSGTFNVKLEASDELWAEYMKETLMNLAAMSVKGFAFNALTIYVDWKQENLYYADPFMFFEFCRRNISRYVSLLHDYPLFEWTMTVRKGVSP
jgi:SAM-dependent methyltransferase